MWVDVCVDVGDVVTLLVREVVRLVDIDVVAVDVPVDVADVVSDDVAVVVPVRVAVVVRDDVKDVVAVDVSLVVPEVSATSNVGGNNSINDGLYCKG